ncbi:MAG: transposase [Lachnospiraceae bacterium]|nr:transposase [Lachnospiraceae bacterium]
MILNNHSPHTAKETRLYLATLPEDRFVFVFSPTYTSWLNIIENFFSKMSQKC